MKKKKLILPPVEKSNITVSGRITKTTKGKLEAYCKSTDRTESAVIRIALKKFLLLLVVVLFIGCYRKGDYQYIIYMKDGSTLKVWNVTPSGGGIDVFTGGQNWYYLSANEYIKADYIGLHNDSKK
jgi:hypothetical protein